ncbi:hypothetical protein VTL71DRAFT_9790 [Oculimacula yallundae]|uniref:Cytochrome P450 n=1 Tax=Oculimacula yallundae TaxID=86028 RepID=A0ABR4BRW4_9HELO
MSIKGAQRSSIGQQAFRFPIMGSLTVGSWIWAFPSPGVKETRTLRIGPNELHIDDPSVLRTIYGPNYNFRKDPTFYSGFTPHTVFTELEPARHKELRKIQSSFFSKQKIAKIQHLLDKEVNHFCEKLTMVKSQGPVHLSKAVRCLTVDIISEYAFAQCFNALDETSGPKFEWPLIKALDIALEVVIDFVYVPGLHWFADHASRKLSLMINPKIKNFFDFQDLLTVCCMQTAGAIVKGFRESSQDKESRTHIPLFQAISSLSDEALLNEAITLITAGSDTTATTLGVAVYEILSDQTIKDKLIMELDQSIVDRNSMPPLQQLEQLQYLSACIKEALRVATAAPVRLPRVVPAAGVCVLQVDNKVIPPGSIVGMSSYTIHFDEDIWGPDAQVFRPERWLGDNAKHLDPYLVPFSTGIRQCIGMKLFSLAYAELRITLAKLFRMFDLSLDPTLDPEDLTTLDYFVATYKGDGVRIIVEGERV